MFEILHRYTKAALYSSATAEDLVTALLEANRAGANLEGANLDRANLRGANLYGANLDEANLDGAYLAGAKGLLPSGTTPLQILGTRHAIIVRIPGFITIGCEHHEVEWWKEHYKALGRRENYTESQVVEYAAHIDYCVTWMKLYGVLEPVEVKEVV